MRNLIYRHDWNSPRESGLPFKVYSHGLHEKMKPGLERQEAAEQDWLFVIFHDKAQVDIGNGWEWLPEDSLVIWRPKDKHYYGNPESSWLHSWIHVAGTEVIPMLQRAGFAALQPAHIPQPLLTEAAFLRIFSEISSNREPDDRILRNLFENWLLEMSRAMRTPASETPSDALKRLKRRLDASLGARLTLAEMSASANMSASHLSAVFKKAYGQSPVRYHMEQRMVFARHLLRERRLTVSEIAHELGYPDLYQFSRMFKRIVGVSPRGYRLGRGA